jgi:hypothetical protein
MHQRHVQRNLKRILSRVSREIYTPRMRRWVAILLLILLPLQFTWAMAASYCRDDQGVSDADSGRYEHIHHGAKIKATSDERSDPGGLDHHCEGCHLSCVWPVPTSHAMGVVRRSETYDSTPSREYESHIPGVPQRPDCSLTV